MIHITMTLNETYLPGSVAGVFSVLQQASCPENNVFHFIASRLYSHNNNLHHIITSTFPYLSFHLYLFDSNLVKRQDLLLHSTCSRSTSQLCRDLPSGSGSLHRSPNHLLRFRSHRHR
ncbi:hypothetical protein SO802_000182 [Lithocarpus litseifolius]|uniref:Uncharacterized protein n=1 Tax=Lithocarpus litseifolius TaxID=425828 RepID=A0AAW2DR96_9ROSI